MLTARIQKVFTMPTFRVFITTIGLSLLAANSLDANEPVASYLFPAGGQQGTTVKVKVGGLFLHESCRVEMLGKGVKVSDTLHRVKTLWFEGPLLPLPNSQRAENYPRDMAGEIQIDAGAEAGVRHVRLWNSEGATASKKFLVGHLPEIVEEEIDGNPIPVSIPHPVTVNGRIFPRADVDIWTVHASKGETLTCLVHADRIDSPLDARLEIRDPKGRTLVENDDTYGADPFLRFTAAEEGNYQIRIHDIRFLGGQDFVYRLTVTADPHVDWVYPLGGKRGQKVQVEVAGQYLPARPVAIELPASGEEFYRHHLQISGKRSNDFLMELDDLPEYLEGDAALEKVAVTIPAVLNGRIEQPGQIDSWRFAATKGAVYQFDLRAGRLGSPLDGVLLIADDKGKLLAQGERSEQHIDPQVVFKVLADGIYTVQIRDRFASRGGPAYAYRLRISPAQPDFRLTVATDGLTVLRKGKAKLRVLVERQNGFQETVSLRIDGLPNGVAVKGVDIPKNKNFVDVSLEAGETVKVQTAYLEIWGAAEVEGKKLTRKAALRTAPGSSGLDTVLLGVALPAPFKIKSTYNMEFVPRGAVHLRKYEIERNGYDGPIEVSLADKQARHLQGVTGPTLLVPAGATEFSYPVSLPPWMEMGRTCRVCVMGVATVTDTDGSRHRVSHSSTAPSEQFVAVVGPGQLAISLGRSTFLYKPGQSIEIPVTVKRSLELKGDGKLELVVPEHINGIDARPITIPAGEEKATLIVRIDARQTGPVNMPLIVRVEMGDEVRAVMAEAEIELVQSGLE
jgi:hypothetical protein